MWKLIFSSPRDVMGFLDTLLWLRLLSACDKEAIHHVPPEIIQQLNQQFMFWSQVCLDNCYDLSYIESIHERYNSALHHCRYVFTWFTDLRELYIQALLSKIRFKCLYEFYIIQPSDPVILNTLMTLLGHERSTIRGDVARTLSIIRPSDPAFLNALVSLLRDKDGIKGGVPYYAALALINIEPTDTTTHQALTALLFDEDKLIRSEAAGIWRYDNAIQPSDPAILNALLALMNEEYDGSYYFRPEATALRDIKPSNPAIHQVLLTLLNNEDENIRKSAAFVCSSIMPIDTILLSISNEQDRINLLVGVNELLDITPITTLLKFTSVERFYLLMKRYFMTNEETLPHIYFQQAPYSTHTHIVMPYTFTE